MECDVSRTDSLHERGMFLDFYFQASTLFNTASTAAPHGSTVSEDAGIEPRTVATLALSVRRTQLDFIYPLGYSNLPSYTHRGKFRLFNCGKFVIFSVLITALPLTKHTTIPPPPPTTRQRFLLNFQQKN